MFEEMFSADPRPQAVATSKAAIDVAYGKVQLSKACKDYNVQEQAVIQYIIDKTEYETMLDILNGNKSVDSIGNK
tara:strand:+ start:1085 stop:1309 length:225 start_codon:yes stop_codon:yes gene_type:complete